MAMLADIPYSLIFSRIKYFAVWLNSTQKQIFTDKIFVVERELYMLSHTHSIISARPLLWIVAQ